MAEPSDPAPAPDRAAGGTDPAAAALARVRSAARVVQQKVRPRPPRLSSARPDDRDPQALGTALDRWIRGNGYATELAVAGLVGRWTEIVGEQLAGHVTVASYAGPDGGADAGLLVLQADSPEWAVQVRYLTAQLQRRIDDEIGPGRVRRIDVRGPGPRRQPGGWRVRTGRRSPR